MRGSHVFITLVAFFAAMANGSASEIACEQELGREAVSVLVRQCLQVSPATHPPCNALNSCEMIRAEVRRGCGILLEAGRAPGFCVSPSLLGKPGLLQDGAPSVLNCSVQQRISEIIVAVRIDGDGYVFSSESEFEVDEEKYSLRRKTIYGDGGDVEKILVYKPEGVIEYRQEEISRDSRMMEMFVEKIEYLQGCAFGNGHEMLEPAVTDKMFIKIENGTNTVFVGFSPI